MRILASALAACACLASLAGGGCGKAADGGDAPPDAAGTDASPGDVATEADPDDADGPDGTAADPGEDPVAGDAGTDLRLDLAFLDGGADVPPDPSCDAAPCAAGTACRAGRCVAGDLVLQFPEPGRLSGAWLPADGSGRVDFTAWMADAAMAEARFVTPAGAVAQVRLAVPATPWAWARATVSRGGPEADGVDAPSPDERAVLDGLVADGLADALARIPLEVACRAREGVDPAQLAALLFPWQALLKHARPDRAAHVRDIAAGLSCDFFADRPTGGAVLPANPALLLSHDTPVPVVAGHFPFNVDGAAEAPEPVAAIPGTREGPCEARCRGACGPDCDWDNCVRSDGVVDECLLDAAGQFTGDKTSFEVVTCGTAAGCREHDDCYDQCHAAYRCGTWSAAGCRRDCDWVAGSTHGFANGISWAQGFGPFDADRLEFRYPVPGAPVVRDLATCPTPEQEMGACWWFYAADGDPPTSSNAYCEERIKKECTPSQLLLDYGVPPNFETLEFMYFAGGEKCPVPPP